MSLVQVASLLALPPENSGRFTDQPFAVVGSLVVCSLDHSDKTSMSLTVSGR
jgi:hypothetical protein